MSSFAPEDSAPRVAYRVLRPGKHLSLHGVWWPRSYDLVAELPALIGVLDSRGFEAGWVSFSQESWPTAASRVRIAGRMVRLGRSRAIQPDMVSLRDGGSRSRADLLVVPPGSHPAMAAHAFARVLESDDHALAVRLPSAASVTDTATAECAVDGR